MRLQPLCVGIFLIRDFRTNAVPEFRESAIIMEHSERYSRKVLAYTKDIPKGIDVHGPEKFPRHALLLIYTSFDGSTRTTVILLRQSTL
jgi:alpha-D-ribose 1-methylphosphonate 5-triphosphate synthase subunit PhnI